ncbi:MAG: metallophosphoesterase [Fibrobacterales bacterium]
MPSNKKGVKVGADAQHEKNPPIDGVIVYPSLGSPEIVFVDETISVVVLLDKELPYETDEEKDTTHKRICKCLSLFSKEQLHKIYVNESFKTLGHVTSDTVVDVKSLQDSFAATQSEGYYLVSDSEKNFEAMLNPRVIEYYMNGEIAGQETQNDLLQSKPLAYPYLITLDAKKVFKGSSAQLYFYWKMLDDKSYTLKNDRSKEDAYTSWIFRNRTLDGDDNLFIGKKIVEDSDGVLNAGIEKEKDLRKDQEVFTTEPSLGVYNIFDFKFQDKLELLPLHPVFYYHEKARKLNTAFVSDLHVVSRLQVMKHTDLRVIPGVTDDSVSPPIGKQIEPHGESLQTILNAIGKSAADILVVGGDLVDFAQDAYPGLESALSKVSKGKKIPDCGGVDYKEVSKLLSFTSDDKDHYQHGVDLGMMFLMFAEFMEKHKKPVLILSGNHDAYEKPFGISPRGLKDYVGDVKLANEGIPADANLSIMEACLAYGENYGAVEKNFNFTPEIMDFYSFLFSPVTTYTSKIGLLQILSLDWMEEEDMISSGSSVIGCLPVATKNLNQIEMAQVVNPFFNYIEDSSLTSVVLSHYTWVCYDAGANVLLDGAKRSFKVGDGVNSTDFNIGTCKINRIPFYTKFKEQKIDFCFSGHAHRAGVYKLKDFQGSEVSMLGLPVEKQNKFDSLAEKPLKKPVFLVADSAGPIPRENNAGEFGGWGSNSPAGLLLAFNDSGKGRKFSIERVSARVKPRLSVSMDYMELMKENDFDSSWWWNFWVDKINLKITGGDTEEEIAPEAKKYSVDITFSKENNIVNNLPNWFLLNSISYVVYYNDKTGKKKVQLKVFKDGDDWFLEDEAGKLGWLMETNREKVKSESFLSTSYKIGKNDFKAGQIYNTSFPSVMFASSKLDKKWFKDVFTLEIKKEGSWTKYPDIEKYEELKARLV